MTVKNINDKMFFTCGGENAKRIEIQTLNENLQEILNNIKQGSLSMGAIPITE